VGNYFDVESMRLCEHAPGEMRANRRIL